MFLPPVAEEIAHDGGAFVGTDAGCHFDAVVQGRVVDDLKQGADGAALWIVAAVDDAVEAAVDDGAGAHGAGLDGDVEGAACEPPTAQGPAGLFNGQELGVSRGAGQGFAQVIGPGNGLFLINDDGAYGNFPDGGGDFCFFYGFAHVKFVFCHDVS